jgi:hypothetical protein
MRHVGVMMLIAVLAAGCGGHKQSKAEKTAMNAEFAKIDFAISVSTPRSLGANQAYLEQLTHRYIAVTRKYADDLGAADVKRRLTTEAEQLAPWCPSCVEILNRELESH